MGLREFFEEIKDCQKCPLAQSRTQIVFGEGPPNARLMFIGEAPGFHEDQQGRPFVGAAGKLLAKLLQSIGLDREQVYIANVLKCRPPDNRNPSPSEIESCLPHLQTQMALIRPRAVCTLGNFSTQLILGKKVGITKVRGQRFQVGNFSVFPMLHPAAALRRGGIDDALLQDFLNLKKFLDLDLKPEQPPQQVGLF